MEKGKLYLIPIPLGENALHSIPTYVHDIINNTNVYIVEGVRTARRFIKAINKAIVIDDLTFLEFNNHTKRDEWIKYLDEALNGKDIGLMSEAGCPAVADPGAQIVALAHRMDIEVVPLVGPNSILLALMGSGLNGQQFQFHGYLPNQPRELQNTLRNLERKQGAQIFIETPYRNMQLFKTMLETLQPTTKICVATDLSLETQFLKTLTCEQWKEIALPELHKHPTVFIIG